MNDIRALVRHCFIGTHASILGPQYKLYEVVDEGNGFLDINSDMRKLQFQ